MGGIQIIATGDFYQLSPVPNKWISDSGDYIFQSNLWLTLVPHKYILSEVQRQEEEEFIKAISETARGAVSQQTVQLLTSLDDGRDRDIHLFARKLDVSLHNHSKLYSIPGEPRIYISEEGRGISTKMRKSVDVPQKLVLKIGAPVILTVNLSRKYVNGLTGTVLSMDDDGVLVYFYDIRDSLKVQPHNFFQYYHKDKSMRFVVRQVPLILGYALTVHKSQGMTLPSVHVDCEGAFAPGQISVALGRVRTKADISVSNFRMGLCPPHPPKVSAFYGTAGVSPAEDISCCRQNVNLPVVEKPAMDTSSTDTASDVDENEREFHLELDTPPPPACHLPDELKATVLKPKILYPQEFTATQKKINNLINSTSDTALDTCVQHFYNELQLIANTHYNKHGHSKQINTVVQKFIQNFRKSEHFNTCLKTLFGTHTLINDHISIGVSVLLRIQDCFFSQSAGINPPTELISSDYTQNNSKVRYVAGMCVGRVISQYSNYLCQHCHEDSSEVTRKKATVRGLQRYLYNT